MLINRFIKGCLFAAFLFSFNLKASDYKLVYVVSPPRSLSTALLRVFETRPDFEVYNEPGILTNKYEKVPQDVLDAHKPETPRTYKEVKEILFEQLKTSHVFAKEINFSVYPNLIEDIDFLSNPNIHFVFLIRDPHSSLISLYNLKDPAGQASFVEERVPFLFDYENYYDLYQKVQKYSPNKVQVILAEHLIDQSESVIETLCKNLDLPHLPSALSFTPHPAEFKGETWHDFKNDHDTFTLWHGTAALSSSINNLREYERDSSYRPTFSEIQHSDHREKLKQFHDDFLPHYNIFKKESLKQFNLVGSDPIE